MITPTSRSRRLSHLFSLNEQRAVGLKTTAKQREFIGHVNKIILKNQHRRYIIQYTAPQYVQEQGIGPLQRHTLITCRFTGLLKHTKQFQTMSEGPKRGDGPHFSK